MLFLRLSGLTRRTKGPIYRKREVRQLYPVSNLFMPFLSAHVTRQSVKRNNFSGNAITGKTSVVMYRQVCIFVCYLLVANGRLSNDIKLKFQHGLREEDMKYGQESGQLTISMPPVKTTYSDQYICYAKSLEDIGDSFVLGLVTEADRKYVHHVSTGVCEFPASQDFTWDCTLQQGNICKGNAVNFGIWDEFSEKNGKFEFPKDVSLRVGSKTKLKYFLIEVHFTEPVTDPKFSVANVTLDFVKNPTKFSYQTYAFMNTGVIPGNKGNGYFSEIACEWKRPLAHAFRYYLHTHHYGILVEGYLIRNGTWILLGSQLSMDKKKDFYNVPGGPIEIRQGDVVAVRCLYINNGSEPVNFGMSEGEEMCGFQLDIGYNPADADLFRRPPTCRAEAPTFKFCNFPATNGLC